MISLILAKKIFSLFLILFSGALMVRLKVAKAEYSRVLSVIAINLVVPCMNIAAFQVDFTSDVGTGLLLAFVISAVLQLVIILLGEVVSRPLRLEPTEKVSSIYANAGNMIIPLVTSLLGPAYVIYVMGYSSVQQFFFWSHCKMTICGEKKIEFKKIFCNINMVAVIFGMILFLLRIRLPEVVLEPMRSVGNMIGPMAMVTTGILIGSMDLKKVFTYRRVWLIAAMRLVVFPLVAVTALRGAAHFLPAYKEILMIPLLAAVAPTASTVTNMSVVYGGDGDYASACNVVTTLMCIITMPVMIFLYQL